jgi:branched-chain amino acid transport system substrate-binding protein
LRFPKFILLLLVLSISAFGVVACGDDDEDTGGGGAAQTEGNGGGASGEVNVYSSLPLQGASRNQTRAMVDGIKLALKQAGNRAGNVTVKYTSLDDSTAQAGTWTPEATSANARRVAQDDKAVAYIGEFNSGASAISMPILNEAAVPQISPANTAVGLTTDEPGAEPGEPDKYYPTGNRHYVRIVPKDTIQGAALATVMKEDGCTNVALANDKEVYGAGLARNIQSSLEEQDIELAFNEGIDPKASNFRSLAGRARSAGADCFVFSGVTANGAVQIYKDFAAALPDAKLYGPDGVAESGFVDASEGGIPASVASRVKLSVATLNPESYPPEGQEFFEQFEQEYNEPNPDPYAIYGYEAMRLTLDAIERAGSTDKADVLQALFDTSDRQSVLGTYSIDENGDTTLTDYGIYTVEDGELTFDKSVEAQASTDTRRIWGERSRKVPLPAPFRPNVMAASSLPAAQPAPVRALRTFFDRYGLIVVLLILPVIFAIDDLRTEGDLSRLANNLVDGLSNGAIWALVAIGYTLVYGIIELINFAHGDVFMLGSFVSASFFGTLGLTAGMGIPGLALGLFLTLVVVMVVQGSLNVMIERVAYRPLRGAPRLAPLITAVGMSFILQNVGLLWRGGSPEGIVDLVNSQKAVITFGSVVITNGDLLAIFVTIPLVLLMTAFINRSRLGKAMRATAQDPEAARLMGINVDTTISATFLIGGMLAGAAGLVYALYQTTIWYFQGFTAGLIAFTAAVMGGIGNIRGAVLGGFIIGIIQQICDNREDLGPLPFGPSWTAVYVFAILVLIMVFKPSGLLGEETREAG